MNTILTILLLIALTIAIVCDIIRIFQYQRTIEESKQNVKEIIYKAMIFAWNDYRYNAENCSFAEYFKNNFDKYL